jgi:cation diffusion facilitator family transporter
MSTVTMPVQPIADVRAQVRRVLLVTLLLNLLVAFSKIGIGVVTGALAITADGFHSLVDGSSNVVALFANRVAQRPPDATHPYGHRRFETLAALGIGAFLLLTAWEIITSAVSRLQGGGEAVILTPLSFAVMIATLVVNIGVNRYEARAGRRLNSELLLADAAHTGTDIYVTLSVLVSMVVTVLTGWAWVDTVAALVIVILIIRAAVQVLRQTGSVLVDTAPFPAEQLEAWVEAVPGVEAVIRARSRGPVDAPQIDLDVQVDPAMSAQQTAGLTEALRKRVTAHIPQAAEIEVHFVPVEPDVVDYPLLARARADAFGVSTHEVQVRQQDALLTLEMHVEVPPGQTLGEAHAVVSALEQDLRTRLPQPNEVITHIEPALSSAPLASDAPCGVTVTEVTQALRQHFPAAEWHDIQVFPVEHGCAASLHVTLPAQITVEAAHHVAETAELWLRSRFPSVTRVTIHTEPPE